MAETRQPRGRPRLDALFASTPCVKASAPMVRYSRLPARLLFKKWGCDLLYTPMFVATSFVTSKSARDSDFTTTDPAFPGLLMDDPLIVQFAANDPEIFVDAATIAFSSGSCDGVDINCGCPQKWTCAEGYGAALMERPDHIVSMLRAARDRIPEVPASVKIRLCCTGDPLADHDNRPTRESLYKTIELARAAQEAGAWMVTVHGRTSRTPGSVPVNLEGIRVVREALSVPVLANGDIFAPADITRACSETGVHGVMSARGLLQNPALYAGYDRLPPSCPGDFLDFACAYGLSFPLIHNHILFMLYPLLARPERKALAECNSLAALLLFCKEMGFWSPSGDDAEVVARCCCPRVVDRAEEAEGRADAAAEEAVLRSGGKEGEGPVAHDGPGRGSEEKN